VTLAEIKEKLKTGLRSESMAKAIETFGANPKKPLGKLNPWAWWVEITRGCNLRCAFCATRLFERGDYHHMDEATWRALLGVMSELTPRTRLEFGNAGEPTLHPDLLRYLRIARETCPHVQIMTHTNGTTLTSGALTYKQLFDAGMNAMFVDMYAPYAVHKKLAEESGYQWYHESEKPEGVPNVFEYQNDPNLHVIRLSESPYSWSEKKSSRGHLQTFFNDLDWKAAGAFDMTPVTSPPRRRCDLPSKFVSINHDGTFSFCCWDFMRHTAKEFGNINNGMEDFFAFWLGAYMQDTRQKVHNKDRASHELCSKCSFVSIRGDIPYWKGGTEQFWDGKAWRTLPPYVPVAAPDGKIKTMRRSESLFDIDVNRLLPKKRNVFGEAVKPRGK